MGQEGIIFEMIFQLKSRRSEGSFVYAEHILLTLKSWRIWQGGALNLS